MRRAGVGGQHALKSCSQQRRRRAFPRDVTENKAESPARKIEVIEKIAANRTTLERSSRDLEAAAFVVRLWHQPTLNLGRNLQFLLLACSFQSRAIHLGGVWCGSRICRKLQQKSTDIVDMLLVHNMPTIESTQTDQKQTKGLMRGLLS